MLIKRLNDEELKVLKKSPLKRKKTTYPDTISVTQLELDALRKETFFIVDYYDNNTKTVKSYLVLTATIKKNKPTPKKVREIEFLVIDYK